MSSENPKVIGNLLELLPKIETTALSRYVFKFSEELYNRIAIGGTKTPTTSKRPRVEEMESNPGEVSEETHETEEWIFAAIENIQKRLLDLFRLYRDSSFKEDAKREIALLRRFTERLLDEEFDTKAAYDVEFKEAFPFPK